MNQTKPVRTPWGNFPPVIASHVRADSTPQAFLIRKPGYPAAKSGDLKAANRIVTDFITFQVLESIAPMIDSKTKLVPVTATGDIPANRLPLAAASYLQKTLGCLLEENIFQAKVLHRRNMSGIKRLVYQPTFKGPVTPGQKYFLVDDVLTAGATLANLKGYIESNGGQVVGATVLLAKKYETILQPGPEQINAILKCHGDRLRDFWKKEIGHDLEQLTEPEVKVIWQRSTRFLSEMEVLVTASQRSISKTAGSRSRVNRSPVVYADRQGDLLRDFGKSQVADRPSKRVRKIGGAKRSVFAKDTGNGKNKRQKRTTAAVRKRRLKLQRKAKSRGR